AGDVGAVAVVVDVGGVFAVGGLARSVELLAIGVFGDVGDEVAAETAVEVGGDVGVVAVDAGVDDADQDAFVARLLLVGPVGGGADHAHVPLKVGEGFGAGGAAGGGVVQGVLVDGRSGGAVAGGGGGADLAVGGGADDGVGGGERFEEGVAGAAGDEVAEPGVTGGGDGAAGVLDGGLGAGAGAVGVEDQVRAVGLAFGGGAGCGGGCRGGVRRRGCRGLADQSESDPHRDACQALAPPSHLSSISARRGGPHPPGPTRPCGAIYAPFPDFSQAKRKESYLSHQTSTE